MMWHILWVFYNNRRDETGGLSPYFDDSYWRSKFDEPAVKFLLKEKLKKLSTAECNSLLDSMGNMAKSRSVDESEFITKIATEMLDMAYFVEHDNAEVAKKCSEVFSEITAIHPFFISAIIMKLKNVTETNEAVIECFINIPLSPWHPDEATFAVLIDWLLNNPINHFYNRLSRVILSKLNWGTTVDGARLFLGSRMHRRMAREIYAVAKKHVCVEDSEDPFNLCKLSGTSEANLLRLACSSQPKELIEWCWRLLLLLKLHLLEQPNVCSKHLSIGASRAALDDFEAPPNFETDCDYYLISKGLARQNPFAVYISLALSDRGHDTSEPHVAKSIDHLTLLMSTKNSMQSLALLAWFIPFNLSSARAIFTDAKFISALNTLLLSEQNELLDRLVGIIRLQLDTFRNERADILSLWINLLYEVARLVIKQWSSSSWFLASSKGLKQVVYLLDHIIEMSKDDEKLHSLLITFFQKPYDEAFAKLIAGSSLFSWLPWVSSTKCEWITPFHVLQQKFPQHVWLSWLLIKSDTVKMEKIWEDLVKELNANLEATCETAIKPVCAKHGVDQIPAALLPINAWTKQILDVPIEHPLMPFLCYNFFLNFFSSSEFAGSVGLRLVSDSTLHSLKTKICALADHHFKLYSDEQDIKVKTFHAMNSKLYRAFSVWLGDSQLHDAFVDVVHLAPQYYTEILKGRFVARHRRNYF